MTELINCFTKKTGQKLGFLIDDCGYYAPAIVYAIESLLEAKKNRIEERRYSKNCYHKKSKISLSQIDQILGLSFSIHSKEAQQIRISYQKQKPIKKNS